MAAKTWFVSEDGKFEFVSLTPATLEGALAVIRDSFCLDENVCNACEVPKSKGAIEELVNLCRTAANDGVSIVAVEKATGIVGAVAFNKLQVRDVPFFDDFIANECKHDESKAMIQLMIDVEAICNLFDYHKIDCLLELMFLSTASAYRGNGLGKKLVELTTNLGKALLKGEMVKVPVKVPLKKGPTPRAISAIFTTFITQRIGRSLNWVKLAEDSFDNYTYKGKTYMSKIGHHTPTITLETLYFGD